MKSPFDLSENAAYRSWRERKLDGYPTVAADLLVPVRNPLRLSAAESRQVERLVEKTNMVLVDCGSDSAMEKHVLIELGQQLGLRRLDRNPFADEDAVSSLRVSSQGRRRDFIPYTDKPLSWHTDGYYNGPGEQIRGWALMCARDALAGGENQLLDHELLYLLMRDENPNYVRALMQADAMTIPPHELDGVCVRPTSTGPVFSLDPADGALHMRYSARGRNIIWKDDAEVSGARDFMDTLFSSDSPYIFRHRLSPGQILLSNNVLHNRSGFTDSEQHRRLIYRARYFDRIRPGAYAGSMLPHTGKSNAETE